MTLGDMNGSEKVAFCVPAIFATIWKRVPSPYWENLLS